MPTIAEFVVVPKAAGVTDISVPADARIAAAVGVTVQAHSANLSEYAAVNPTAAGLAVLGAADAAAQTALLSVFAATKGLVPASGGGTANFLRADGTFAAPTAGAPTISTTEIAPATSQTIATGLSAYVARRYEITGALSLTLDGTAVFEIG